MIEKILAEFKEKGYFEKYDEKWIEQFKVQMQDVIIPVQTRWDRYTEEDLVLIIKKFSKICRGETSILMKDVLSSETLAGVLLKIANSYKDNDKILIEILSSIGNMHKRYDLKVTDDVFQFFLDQTKNKKVNFYASLFINDLPQFDSYDGKWDYILSIPKIAPRNKSINTFYRVVMENIKDIPINYKSKIKEIFEKFISDSQKLHPATVEKYTTALAKIENK